ncbi:MAG TPA: hypothetical protein VNU01_02160 [Egibacteraceae bacterium]|nr:hypothetical protein [Egibacteraceae bacterium]
MPWQRYVADVAGEYDALTRIPFYRDIGTTVPRQQGKTTLSFAEMVDRGLNWGSPQRSVFTAQTGKDARDKFLDEIFPNLRASKLMPLVKQILEGMGNEGIRWKTGSILRLASTSAGTGHGKTIGQAMLDEIWHDVDDRREQGLRPAMLTVADAQLWWWSTAGTAASTIYNRKVKTGRGAVLADTGSGTAFFDWGAGENWDPDDWDSYFGFMPALCPNPPCRCGDGDGGWRHTVTLDVLKAERAAMSDGEYRRAYGNIPTAGADVVIPLELWRELCDPDVKPEGALRFGLAVSPERESAAIVSCADGVLELVDHRAGTGWVVDRCNALTAKHGGKVALDKGGPAGVFADEIRSCDAMQGGDVIRAHGAFYDAVIQKRVKFRTDPALDAAVEGAVKKIVGDNWVWSRRASMNDVTPLEAATLAYAPAEARESFFLFS